MTPEPDLAGDEDEAATAEAHAQTGTGGAPALRLGVTTVACFVAMPPKETRSLLTVVGIRVQTETHVLRRGREELDKRRHEKAQRLP